MSSTTLPARPHLAHLKKQAKDLLRRHRAGDPRLCPLLRRHLPRLADRPDDEVLAAPMTLHDAQHVVARQYGFDGWDALRHAVESAPAAAGAAPAGAAKVPRFDQLDERLRRHLEALGFTTVGGYRIWCHQQGLGRGLDKDDAQLALERERARQLGGQLEPQVHPRYRRGQAEFIRAACAGNVPPDRADHWLVLLFAVTADTDERDALCRLLLQVEKYTGIPWESAAALAARHRQWRQPVERFFPRCPIRVGQLRELSRFLLGHEQVPPLRNAALDRAVEAAARARVDSVPEGQRVLSAAQVADFREKGWVRVPEAFAPAAALAIQAFMWSQLRRLHGFERDDPSTWKIPGRTRILPGDLRLNETRDHEVYRQVATPRLLGAMAQLAGARVARDKQSWGGFGLTFPEPPGTAWQVPTGDWHLDVPALTPDRLIVWPPPSVRVLTFYSRVEAGGGGTLVVEGSHRLVVDSLRALGPLDFDRKQAALADRFARSHPWLAELTGKVADGGDRTRRFMQEGAVIDGVPVRVAELTGAPGDAILWHPALYRGRSRNCGATPRFVRS